MRFGDTRTLALDLDPVAPTWELRTASDRGPWARLSIWIRQENFCENWLASTREVHDGVYVPLAPIADWFVRNARAVSYQESAPEFPTDVDLPRALEQWKSAAPARSFDEDTWDDHRFEWSDRHFLLSGADGAWLPNLAFVRVDETLWVSAGPVDFASAGAPRFTYRPGTYPIAWRDAKTTIAEFVDFVGGVLRTTGLTAAYPWSAMASAFDHSLAIDFFDYLRLSLGLQRAKIEETFQVTSPEDLHRKLDLPLQASPQDSVVLQALRDLEIEEGVVDIAMQCDFETRVPGTGIFRQRRLRALDAAPERTPEEQGHAAAQLMRQDLGLNGEAVTAPEDLLKGCFDIEVQDRPDLVTLHDHSVAGAHRDGLGKVFLLGSSRSRKPWSRRMELFRCVGHLLLDAGSERLAVGAGSSTRAVGPRRRRSGAFAAEMLLPQSVIRKRCGGVLDEAARPELFESLMAEYGVGAQTAAWQCWNAGLLSSREVVYELITQYGSEEP